MIAKTMTLGLTVALVLCANVNPLVAQDIDQESRDLFLAPAPKSQQPDPALSDVERQMAELTKVTNRMRQRVALPQDNSIEESVREPQLQPPRLPDKGVDAALSITEIRSRIQLIKQLKRKTAAKLAMRKPRSPSPPPFPPPQLAPDPEPQEQNSSALDKVAKNLEQPTEQPAEPVEKPEQSLNATKILSEPVDPMRLGESLYRTRNFAAALKALQAVKEETLAPGDQAWRDLLIALCQKRIGNLSAAEEDLRALANEKGRTFSSSIASWWLKQSKSIEDKRPMVNNLSKEVDSLIERSYEHAQQ